MFGPALAHRKKENIESHNLKKFRRILSLRQNCVVVDYVCFLYAPINIYMIYKIILN